MSAEDHHTGGFMKFPQFAGALVLCMVGGCNPGNPAAPADPQDERFSLSNGILVSGVHARLDITPGVVERTATFTATLTLTNQSAVAASWTSGMGCLAFLNVYRNEQRVPLRGTDFACLAVVSHRMLLPGESLAHSWQLVAQTTDGSRVQPGEYILEADPVVASRVTFRQPFTVR
jgi:hypothetical protein